MELSWIGRISLAGLLTAVIGLERQYQHKEAGLRTHFLVGIGSATMMIVSKYAFGDLGAGASFDPSRVASQVVSGVGFIGAGTIIFRRNVVHGLTTAAGLWAASAIGLAIGAGLYTTGIAATALILTALASLDRIAARLAPSKVRLLSVIISDQPGGLGRLTKALAALDAGVDAITLGEALDDKIAVDLRLRLEPGTSVATIATALERLDGVQVAERPHGRLGDDR